ncbi:MAG: hypothetical protein JJU11_07205, partial [Candidatus Sumerlaeia bacterium]|nr:hypothetical protein [Candidatus Sumerlaeia bacterium]
MKKFLPMTLSALLVGATTIGGAQVIESFTDLSGDGSASIAGDSTFTGATFAVDFGPPHGEISDADPLGTFGNYLSLADVTDAELTFTFADPIANTEATHGVAVAIRVNNLNATPGGERGDVTRFQDGVGNLHGLVFRDGILRKAGSNGWPTTPAIVDDLSEIVGEWIVVAGIVNQSTDTDAASASYWVYNPDTDSFGDVVEFTDVTNSGIGDIEVFQTGATWAFPGSGEFTYDIDEVA